MRPSMCRFRPGCPVTGTCAEQNRGLVQFLPLPPPLPATRILCLRFRLRFEMLKGHLEFHGNLPVVQRHVREYFPSLTMR